MNALITYSTIQWLKSKIELIDKMLVPPCCKLKHMKVVSSQELELSQRTKS